MVSAIMEDRKVMTRRIVKEQPSRVYGSPDAKYTLMKDGDFLLERWPEQERMMQNFGRCKRIKCPYGQVADIIYVRETYYAYGIWQKNGVSKSGKQKWRFIDTGTHYEYPGSAISKSVTYKSMDKDNPGMAHWYKRNSLFMPKKTARIWLEITDIRVERLQDITEEDAHKEGVLHYDDEVLGRRYKNYIADAKGYGDAEVDYPAVDSARSSFMSLWFKINGEESYEENVWIWVISFKVLSKTGKPIF